MDELTISCLIVDDEPLALSLIEGYVKKTSFLSLKGKCNNAIEVLQIINKEPIDLIFLDIQMPDLSGIDLSKTLKKSTRVIFTTAFDKYALESYKAEAIDYLLKPFNYTEFLLASNKALEWFSIVNNSQKAANVTSIEDAKKKFIFVKSEYKQLKITLSEVLYFEGLKDYIKIWLHNNPKPILTLMSLKSIELELSTNSFMRIHRSYIISLDKIDMVERSQVIIANKRITVSEQYKPNFQNYISKNSLI